MRIVKLVFQHPEVREIDNAPENRNSIIRIKRISAWRIAFAGTILENTVS